MVLFKFSVFVQLLHNTEKTVEKSTALFHSGMLIIQQLKYDKR